MKLLSVSLPRHDGSMAYFDGVQVHYVKLERVKQIKRYSLDQHWMWPYEVKVVFGVDVADIDAFVFDFHAETFYSMPFPEKIQSVLDGREVAVRLTDDINIFKDVTQGKPAWYVSHHYAHALSSWMLLDAPATTHIVVDGVGDHRTWSVYKGDKLVASGLESNGSIGGYTMGMAASLGIQAQIPNDLPGKLMGLQSYAQIDPEFLSVLRKCSITDIHALYDNSKWVAHKGNELVAHHTSVSWARTVLTRVEELLVELFKSYVAADEVVTYSGGVAQNVVWNTELKKQFKNMVIPPHSGDEGLSLGALEYLRTQFDLPKFKSPAFPYIQADVAPELPTDDTIKTAAQLLASNNVIAWYQGNGEVGPRALGNRSILMNPLMANGKDWINRIKRRETYRPFGASVLEEYADSYFDLPFKDEFMLYTAPVKAVGMDAITHIDGTCRVQTVGDRNPVFKKLLLEFYALTRVPILLNTSLNLAGKPIAGYPEVAKTLFSTTELDAAFIGNTILTKQGVL